MEETILTANALKFRYDPEQPTYALNGVSVGVRRGEFVAVLGANGCGKSTLAKHFNAILLPESGTVLVEGMDTRDEEKIYDIRQKVGMVFQSPDNQIVATVVEEDVAFALENLGVPPEEMRRRVDDAMKMAGIYEYRERAPHNLSGGQKQRVAIAGVVAMRPDCLILDEATAMLDPRGREQVMQTIHRLNKDLGITVVAITHYMEEAAQADRVLVMSQGHVVMEGTPKEVFSQTEKVRALRLDVPQAAELRDELVKAGIPMPEGIICTAKLPAVLSKFREFHPKVNMQVTIDTPEQLIRMMEHNGLDLIYILDTPRWDQNWVKVMEKAEPVVFVASADSEFAGKTLKMEDILEEPFFLTEKNANYRQALDQQLALKKQALSPVLEISDTAFIIRMLEKNHGLSFLPYLAVERDIRKGRIALLHVEDVEISMYRQIFYHKNKFKTREMEEFIRLAAE